MIKIINNTTIEVKAGDKIFKTNIWMIPFIQSKKWIMEKHNVTTPVNGNQIRFCTYFIERGKLYDEDIANVKLENVVFEHETPKSYNDYLSEQQKSTTEHPKDWIEEL